VLDKRKRLAGQWGRALARSRWQGLIRTHPWAFLYLALATPGVALLEQRVVHGWYGGAIFGGAVVAGIASVVYVATNVSGSASVSMGARAERWTATELKKVKRLGATTFDHLEFYDGDVDHVLVGKGMVLAIETKWRGGGWDLAARRNRALSRAAEQAQSRANRLTNLLRSRNVEAKRDAVPILVLWGGCDGNARRIDGVLAMSGTDFVHWYRSLDDNSDLREQARIVARLEDFAEGQLSRK
jgi:hypothetical protein